MDKSQATKLAFDLRTKGYIRPSTGLTNRKTGSFSVFAWAPESKLLRFDSPTEKPRQIAQRGARVASGTGALKRLPPQLAQVLAEALGSAKLAGKLTPEQQAALKQAATTTKNGTPAQAQQKVA